MQFKKAPLLLPPFPRLHRLIPSHFPPIHLFESVADAEDLDLVYAIEALTNDRLRDEVGILERVAPTERVCGPGSSPLMAAFTHLGNPSRFSDGSYGVYYGANNTDTAIAETIYHREVFLQATQEPDTEITMREYINQVVRKVHDLREPGFAALYDPNDYRLSQRYASQMHANNSNGLLYHSVRRAGGLCVAAFKPKTLTIPIQGAHFRYVWNGHEQKIVDVLRVSQVRLPRPIC
jgi:hypothetical protein